MKNNLLNLYGHLSLLVMVGLMMASCEKPLNDDEGEESKSNNGKESVVLRVTEFKQVPFDDANARANAPTRAMTDLTTYCTHLNFVVFKDGKKIDSKSQLKGDSGFGEVSFSLYPDTYNILVLAHSSTGGNPTLTNPESIQFTNNLGYSDTFSYYGELRVSAEENNHELVLTRNVSCLRFEVKDEFPAEVKYMKFSYTGGSGVLNAVTGYGGNVNSQQEKIVDISGLSTPLTFNIYTFLREEESVLQLTVEALKSNRSTVFLKREFKDIPMKYRMVTEYTGYFFDAENSFSIMAETDWGDPYYKSEY